MSDINAITYTVVTAVTTSDTVDDANGPYAALLCTGAGNVRILAQNGLTAVTIPVTVGQTLPIAVRRIFTTSTTATVLGLSAMPYKRVGP